MELATILTTILIAGATAVAEGIATEGVKECYQALKSKISDWFHSNQSHEGEMALSRIEEDSETWSKPLEKSLATTEATANLEIMELAKSLNEAIKNSPKTVQGLSKYNISMDNCKIGVIGDNVTIHTLNI